jgi:hypothetical protein
MMTPLKETSLNKLSAFCNFIINYFKFIYIFFIHNIINTSSDDVIGTERLSESSVDGIYQVEAIVGHKQERNSLDSRPSLRA